MASATSSLLPPRELIVDLETLRAAWKQSKKIETLAFQCFEKNLADAYLYALDLMINTGDFYKNKPCSLSHAIMSAFYEWTKRKTTLHPPPFEVKNRALQTVLKQRHQSLIKLVIKTYRIDEDAGYFMNTIEQLLEKEKFNEAFHCVLAMNLQEKFTLDQIVLPLIFQDKRDLAVEYIKELPELKLSLATTLDSVCLSRDAIENLFSTLRMKDIRRSRLDPKWFQKFLWNILKKCDIPIENCPNLRQVKGRGALKYLLYKRYVDQSMSADSFEELVIDCVQDDCALRKELLVFLVCYNDSAAAQKMVKRLNIPPEHWPDSLKIIEDDQNTESWDSEMNEPSQPVEYLSLEIDPSDVHVIETTAQFVDCLTDIIANYQVVGVDAEWKPSFGILPEKLSLLQLALSDKIFLIDFLSLSPHLEEYHFDLLLNNFFSNPGILKLGYGISTDLKMLMKYCHRNTDFKHGRILDVGPFYEMLQKNHPDIITTVKNSTVDVSNVGTVKGLSRLCQVVLGKPLLKDEQFSDWEKRPLRETQIFYAALDAYCLLKIYDALCNIMDAVGLDAETAVDDFFSAKWKVQEVKSKTKAEKKALKEKNKARPSTSTSAAKEPIAIKDFKVVVDNMLQGLGRYLRIYGADVVILENHDEHTDCVKFAFAQERIILSNGAPFQQIRSHVPEDMCLCIPATLDAKEQAKLVFHHFNVQLNEGDIFSRCTICNGDEYVEIPSERLMNLWLRAGYSNSSYQHGAHVESGLFDKYCAKMQPGVSIQMENLSENVFKKVKEFLVCAKCGKVYWEGSHHMRIKETLSNMILAQDGNGATSEEISTVEHLDQRIERLTLSNSDEGPSSSCEKPYSDLIRTPAPDVLEKNSGANSSRNDSSNDFHSYRSKRNIMDFDEDLSDDDESDFIVFNS